MELILLICMILISTGTIYSIIKPENKTRTSIMATVQYTKCGLRITDTSSEYPECVMVTHDQSSQFLKHFEKLALPPIIYHPITTSQPL